MVPVTPTILEQALSLLSGDLRDSTGAPLAAPRRAVSIGHARISALYSGDQRLHAALEAGGAVVIPVPTGGHDARSRTTALLLARWRISCAKRVLLRSGATRVRVLAIVAAGDALFLAYEVGSPCRHYVETRIVLEPSGSRYVAAAKSAVSAVSGVSLAAELLMAVGERS